MSTIVYVVSKLVFNNNADYYEYTGGVNPVKAFLNQEQAKEYAADLSLKTFKEEIIDDEFFYYSSGEIMEIFNTSKNFDNFCHEKFQMNAFSWFENKNKINYALTKDEWKEFYKFCKIQFVQINKVELGDVFS